MTGRSRPYCFRSWATAAGSAAASRPRYAVTASPGRRSTVTKMRIEAARRVTIPAASRVATTRNIASLPAAALLLLRRLAEPEVPEAVPAQRREHVRLDSVHLLAGAVDRLLEVGDDVAPVVPMQLLGGDGKGLAPRRVSRRGGLVDEPGCLLLGR